MHSFNWIFYTINIPSPTQAAGDTPLTGSFDVKFPGVGSFRVTFNVTDSGHSFKVAPDKLDGIAATASSRMVGQTLNGTVSFKPSK